MAVLAGSASVSVSMSLEMEKDSSLALGMITRTIYHLERSERSFPKLNHYLSAFTLTSQRALG
jgi:hypothetical protein